MRAVRLLILCAGGALSAAMIVGAIHGGLLPPVQAIVGYGAAFFTIAIGLLVWEIRPESRTGILVTAIPFAYMLSDLNVVFRSSQLGETVGLGAGYLVAPLIAQVVLGYPSGRLIRASTASVSRRCTRSRPRTASCSCFFTVRARRSTRAIWSCASCAIPYTHVAWLNLISTDRAFERALLALALIGLALLVRKLVRAAPGARPVVLPLVFATAFIVVEFSVQIVLYGHSVDSWTHPTWFWIVTAAPLSVPVALALGLLWGRGGAGHSPVWSSSWSGRRRARFATRSREHSAIRRSSSRCGCRSAGRMWTRTVVTSRCRLRAWVAA